MLTTLDALTADVKCNKCQEIKPGTDFYIRPYRKTIYRQPCIDCCRVSHKNYLKALPLKEQKALAKQKNLYNREIVRRRRAKLLEYLGGKCVDCGIDNPSLLDIDHKEPKKKTFNVSGTNLLKNWNRILEETDKCVLRCKNDHWLKTIANRDMWSWRDAEAGQV